LTLHSRIVDLEKGSTELLPGHSEIVISVDCYKDFFITGSKDSTIRLWKFDGTNSKNLAVFKGHTKGITSVCMAPKNGFFFMSASQDNSIKMWNLKSFVEEEKENEGGKVRKITSAMRTTVAHDKYINVVKVSPNNKIIATASHDRSIKVIIFIIE
jgi:U3 small nucleolar RNA-associated protein 13